VPDQIGLQLALARLAPGQRAVLILRFYEDLTEVETAKVLGCSVSTVKSQARDALTRHRLSARELLNQPDRPSRTDGGRGSDDRNR
jgi:DNA-directed RNA polymerase specialized sigma24 family protein